MSENHEALSTPVIWTNDEKQKYVVRSEQMKKAVNQHSETLRQMARVLNAQAATIKALQQQVTILQNAAKIQQGGLGRDFNLGSPFG